MGQGLRVLMVVPQYPPPVVGGLERQAHELAKRIANLGLGVRVLSGRTRAGQPRCDDHEGIEVVRVPFPRSRAFRFPVSGIALMVELIRHRSSFDVLHAHNLSWFGALAVVMARLLGKPVLAKLPTAPGRAFRKGSLRSWLFRQCDAIALLSEESIAELRRQGFPEDRILCVTNGVSMGSFHPASGPDRSDSGPVTAIFTGRLIPLKGLLDLLAVWPAVASRCVRPVRLRICGEGPQRAELARTISRSRIGASVTLEGYTQEVGEALRAADLFVLPSAVEGNSNAVLEAMASGLPVISTRVGGTPLLVGPEGRAWLVEPGDRQALEERLVRLLGEPETRQALGRAMLDRIRRYMTIERVAERYRAAYVCLARGERDRVGEQSSPVFLEK